MTDHASPACDPLDVLIVEDEALLAEELAFLVREAGLRDVGHAMSSAEAFDLAEGAPGAAFGA